jgi:hypothetical protein
MPARFFLIVSESARGLPSVSSFQHFGYLSMAEMLTRRLAKPKAPC